VVIYLVGEETDLAVVVRGRKQVFRSAPSWVDDGMYTARGVSDATQAEISAQ
jgi:hypothetical protein